MVAAVRRARAGEGTGMSDSACCPLRMSIPTSNQDAQNRHRPSRRGTRNMVVAYPALGCYDTQHRGCIYRTTKRDDPMTAQAQATRDMSSTDRIEKKVALRAPRSRVWRAIANAEEFGTWFRIKLDGAFAEGAAIRGRLTVPGYEHATVE